MSTSAGTFESHLHPTIGEDDASRGSALAGSAPVFARTVDAGLVIDVIDGDHVTLVAVVAPRDNEAISHRLRTLIGAGVRHISIDLGSVEEIHPSAAACMTDVALCLTDAGGSLELLNVRPTVAIAFTPSSTDGASRMR